MYIHSVLSRKDAVPTKSNASSWNDSKDSTSFKMCANVLICHYIDIFMSRFASQHFYTGFSLQNRGGRGCAANCLRAGKVWPVSLTVKDLWTVTNAIFYWMGSQPLAH